MARRVVVDRNVVVAGLRSRNGASARLLELVGTGLFYHCLSVPLLFEYEDALSRPGAVSVPRRSVEAVLDYLAATADRRQIYFLWRPQLPDAHDDLVLELAVAGQCDTVGTINQRDFVGVERFGLTVQTLAALLLTLRHEGLL